jgi:hypothetical protein
MENRKYKDLNNYCDDTFLKNIPSTKERAKDTITSLELVEQINIFRKQEGKKKDLRHDTLLNIIRNEFEDEIQAQKILELFYEVEVGNGAKKKYPMYILTLDQAKQILMRESKFVRRAMIHYIEELEHQVNNLSKRLTEREKLILDIYEGGVKGARASKLLLELETKELKENIKHKGDIIKGLTDDIPLMDKRQILNRVVRYDRKVSFQTRWRTLYLEFEGKYHINLDLRVENYNKKYKKHISKLDYICNELHQLDDLYNIACKLFAGDIEKIIAEYRKVI